MSATELLNFGTQLFFIALGTITTIDFLRSRDVIRRDIALLFCALALALLIQLITQLERLAGIQPSAWLGVISLAALLSEPYILLRLTRYLRPVPSILLNATLVGMLIAFLAVLFLAAVVPLVAILILVAYFVIPNAYATFTFVQGANNTQGVVRQRLKFAAAGAGLFALLLIVAGLAALFPAIQGIVALLTPLIAIACAIAFYIGFAPPRWFRHVWQSVEINNFLGRISAKPLGVRLEVADSMQDLCVVANQAVGGMATGIIQKDSINQQWKLAYKVGELPFPAIDHDGILAQVWQEKSPRLLLASEAQNTSDVRLLEIVGAHSLLVVPITTQGSIWGMLITFLQYGSLFIEDDLSLLTVLVKQSAVFLENGVLVEQQRHHTDQLNETLRLTESLYETSRRMLEARGFAQLLQIVFDYASKYHAGVASLLSVEVDESGKPAWITILARAEASGGVGSPLGTRYHLSEIPFTKYWVDSPKDILLVEDALTDSRYDETSRALAARVGVRASITMPLTSDGAWMGLMSISWAEPHHFSVIERQFYGALHTLVTTVFERERLRDAEQRALEKLTEQESHYRLLAENINDMITKRDKGGVLTYTSSSSQGLLGYAPDELTGQVLDGFIHPDDMGKVQQSSDPAINGSTDATTAFRMKHKAGHFVWVEMTSRCAVDHTGAQEIVSTTRNITQRKQAEEAVQTLNAALEQRAVQLAVANKELEAFSYSVSHDLRAPLRALDGFSQALQEDYSDQLDAEGNKYLARIRASSQRMAQLIDDLLELSRIARSEMQVQPVDLRVLAHKIETELREEFPSHPVKFVVADQLPATGDPRLLRIALVNLLNNAWKYTSKLADAQVEFGTTIQHNRSVYFVRDNGAGFDMTYADKLFGVFQRLHSANEFPGNGVGLATVQRIIHRHGGQIWAESTVGQGTTFYFSL